MAENQIKDKLEQVMAAETNSLLAKAEYVFATCKAIAEDKDRNPGCEQFIRDIYRRALELNVDE